MTEPGQISFRGVQRREIEGNYDARTGTFSDLSLVDLNKLEIRGNYSQRDLQRLQRDLGNTNLDTTAQRERIATRSEDDGTTRRTTTTTETVKPPDDYTNSQRYTAGRAGNDADLREGFRSDDIKTFQRDVLGLKEDATNSRDRADGMWGPGTQEHFQNKLKEYDLPENSSVSDLRRAIDERSERDGTRRTDGTREDYRPVTDRWETGKELTQDIRAGNQEDVNRFFTQTDNADMRRVADTLERNPDGTFKKTPGADNLWNKSEDTYDLHSRMLQGNRNEGADGRVSSNNTEQLADKLVRSTYQENFRWAPEAINGTNEKGLNEVFSRASGAQLQELDRRLRNEGIRDSEGYVIKNKDGLRGLVTGEVEDTVHRDNLLAQLNRPLD